MAVYVWGSNAQKGLGLEDCQGTEGKKSVVTPQRLQALDGLSVKACAAGEGHSIVVTEHDDVLCFGRGKEGQLGGSEKECERAEAVGPVQLRDESIITVAAGAKHSLAVSRGGKLWMWGLIPDRQGAEGSAQGTASSAAGRAAQVQHAPPQQAAGAGVEAPQQHPGGAEMGQAMHMLNMGIAEEDRHTVVSRVVRASEQQWAMATHQAQGSDAEAIEANEESQQDYQGLLFMNVALRPSPVPLLVSELSRHHVVGVSAGYGHSLCITAQGKIFACGYNDRGQLGIGNRMNSNTFVLVRALARKCALKVECGSMHSMALVVDSPDSPAKAAEGPTHDDDGKLPARGARGESSDHDGSGEEASWGGQGEESGSTTCVYVWGNGSLGQLGLGLLGKGKLLPQRVLELDDKHVTDLGAGANHSACVTADGLVYCWGHSEYNQMGCVVENGQDLHNSSYFYSPRLIQELRNSNVHAVQVECGCNFTLVLTKDGKVWSWGWGEFGELGHSTRLHPRQNPNPAPVVGLSHVTFISAGTKHNLAVSSCAEGGWQVHRQLLKAPSLADICLQLGATSDESESGDKRGFVVFEQAWAHRAVLSCRCPFLEGFIGSLLKEREEAQEERNGGGGRAESGTGHWIWNPSEERDVPLVQLVLNDLVDGACASSSDAPATRSPPFLSVLLEYLYTDILSPVLTHAMRSADLLLLGKMCYALGIPRLASLCGTRLSYKDRRDMLEARAAAKRRVPVNKAAAGRGAKHHNGDACEEEEGVPPSTFGADFSRLAQSGFACPLLSGGRNRCHADVRLAFPSYLRTGTDHGDDGDDGDDGDADVDGGAEAGGLSRRDGSNGTVFYAHKAMLCRVPYFRSLLQGGFAEASAISDGMHHVDMTGLVDEGLEHGASVSLLLRHIYGGSAALRVKLRLWQHTDSPLEATDDSLPPWTISPDHAGGGGRQSPATGTISGVEWLDPNTLMELVAGANRLGLESLLLDCERELRQAAWGDASNAQHLRDFAQRFDLAKLDKSCVEALRREAEYEGGPHGESARPPRRRLRVTRRALLAATPAQHHAD